MEAFSSQGDGTLTIIKETSPTEFAVEQTVTTMERAKTCTLDTKNNRIVLIATERPANVPAATNAASTNATSERLTNVITPQLAAGTNQPNGNRRDRRGSFSGPAMLDILVVGK